MSGAGSISQMSDAKVVEESPNVRPLHDDCAAVKREVELSG